MELTIFDKSGRAQAYIAYDDEETIYLWNGKPVAYSDGEHVYGINGKHLGWFENGVLYDEEGSKIGFTQQTCPSITSVEPIKSVRQIKPVKSVQQIPPVKPVFSLGNSVVDLSAFLEGGS